MKRALSAGYLLSFCFIVLGSPRPAFSQLSLFNIAGAPLILTGGIRTREYFWSYFDPAPAANGRIQNQYNDQANVLRLGLGYQTHGVKVFAEMMNPALFNLPANALAFSPLGPLGLGATYYVTNRESLGSSVFLKQGFIEFENDLLKGLDGKAGRFEFFDGADLIPVDPQLRWLVLNEIQQRLIGNFGWSDVMRSFDGGTVRYGKKNWNATLMVGIPTQGVFDLHGMNDVNKVNVAYGALNAGPDETWGNSVGRIFYVHYQDGRGLIPVDNEPAALAATNRAPIRIETIGADFVHTVRYGPGAFDALVWGAYQFGSWGNQAQRAGAFTAQLGYRFSRVNWQPWLRLLYTFASGDSNPNNGTHGTFYPILPTPRLYALDPFYNMMNLKDAGAELMMNPAKRIKWRTTLHGLWLASSRDLWYAGGGAYNNTLFGCVGLPSHGHDYLATVMNSGPTLKIDRHLSISFYIGHAFGGPVVTANFPSGHNETLIYAENKISF
jgi:hypothetical protein